jgi:deferrochelatase/peroxidase EfeB
VSGRASRRSFLRGALAGAGAGAGAGLVAGFATEPSAQAKQDATVPFHGEHQAGILPPPARQSAFVSFDVLAGDRGELTGLLRTLTDRARLLTAGGSPAPEGIAAPADDSGVLGPDIPGTGLAVTVAFGASLFDDRYRLADRKPAHLNPMRTFPDDALDPAWCHGDLLLQLTAPDNDTVLHALRDLARHTRGAMQIRWRMDGFTSPPRPDGTPRNLMGFKDGTSNPDITSQSEMDRLVWASRADEPAWTAGGSYQVVRLIRMLVEFWDRVTVTEQEEIFGRRKDTGAPLSGGKEFDDPGFGNDPVGTVTPLTSHIRKANPRSTDTGASRFLRRAYNYDRGVDGAGNLDQGLIFTAFQQDIGRQFEATQTRLAGEPLVDYITPFGGGYFFALPGVTGGADYFGRSLVE